ncbi:tRNA(Ile)-lysidine synthase [Sodalis glossinidius str. 'morsitans']|uniref:tRNA(Ile)-lysidine synthase n=1 Tax=Sodalis glossinidius (strain morsitans) TaxID=343509 RepID=Q2NRM4_SODGM|nr:tRNA lysidine(34) synthetase TilS [Sodalis glossinidius]BAE75201.1 cell cycle protein [Sodalis glossinidius str. 'morsitans']CRL46187.1 tRNA(Ile)-lysidine synthase [Sodalis glossinidius str. 'morsitans']
MKPDAYERVQVLRRHVAARVAPYRALLLAFSGGLDSTVLLDALAALRDGDGLSGGDGAQTLRAVHVHHALSRHADEWAAHCAQECRRRDVAFTVVHVVVDATSEGIEAAARGARYGALAAALTQDEVLITAQHQDDQAETLLLALKRGSGPAGLASMAVDAPYLGHRLVRPLLDFSRGELEAYAQARGLHWTEDDSNTDLRFDRNFLRLRILPPLRQRWPQFANAVARSAQLCAEQEQLLDELLAETLADVIAPDESLRLTALATMSESKRAALLRRWLASLGVRMPARAQLARLWQEVALSRRDAVAQLKLDGRLVRRFRDRLYVVPRLPPLTDGEAVFPWPRESERLALPAGLGNLYRRPVDAGSAVPGKPFIAAVTGGGGLEERQDGSASCASDADHAANTDANADASANYSPSASYAGSTAAPLAVVRAPLSGEQVSVRFGPVHGLLYIVGRRRGRTLKKIWQELDIPPWRRSSTPLLFYNDQLITALGVFVTWEGAVREHHAQWQLFWRPDSNGAMAAAPEGGGQNGVLSDEESGSH